VDITTNTTEIQRIIMEYCKNTYSNKLESLEEMDKFVDAIDLPKLSQEDINHLNRFRASNKIKVVTKMSPGLDGFTAEFYKSFKEELTPRRLKIFHGIEREGKLSTSFYETSIITLILKPTKEATKNKIRNQTKFLNKIIANQVQ
jgi:hypothetical protein